MAKKKGDEYKGIAAVILGIVAIIAIVGLVLLFSKGKAATGQGVYGGAYTKPFVERPYGDFRGVPRNIPGDQRGFMTQSQNKQSTTNYNFGAVPKRSNQDIPSLIRKCGKNGRLVSLNQEQAGYYSYLGYDVVDAGGKPGLCVYTGGQTLVGGIAGR